MPALFTYAAEMSGSPAMPNFIAHVDLTFEADDLNAGGRRLHELSRAARTAGFELRRGRVEPLLEDAPPSGWTRYTPDGEDDR